VSHGILHVGRIFLESELRRMDADHHQPGIFVPRNALLLNGGELSQATGPFKSGIAPSSPAADVITATPQMRVSF
jgi:hypothetical protein